MLEFCSQFISTCMSRRGASNRVHGLPTEFRSRHELTSHWYDLLRGTAAAPAGMVGGLPVDYSVNFAPGNGWKYTVSLARPKDCPDIVELSQEFVRSHVELFPPAYTSVAQDDWGAYMGFQDEVAMGFPAAAAAVARHARLATRLTPHAFEECGCLLKVEAKEEAPPRPEGRPLVAAKVATAAVASRNGAASKESSPVVSRQSGVVGYVKFDLKQGRDGEQSGPRRSTRLRVQRGENFDEYIKVSHLVVANAHCHSGVGCALLVAMLQCVHRLDPAYVREIFLTAMQKNQRAVSFYKRLGMKVEGENTTCLAGDPGLPAVWYQMLLKQEDIVNGMPAVAAHPPSPSNIKAPERAVTLEVGERHLVKRQRRIPSA